MSIDDDGAIARFMRFLFGRCWKTTTSSYLTAGALIVHELPEYFPDGVVKLSTACVAVGLIGMGRFAKDFDKTGTGKKE